MSTASPIRVLLIEDSPLVRQGVRAAIASEPTGEHLVIVGEAGTAAAGLSEAQRLLPDVVLLDLRLPDSSGLNVCRLLRQSLPKTGVLVLSSSTDSRTIQEAILAGAHGYLFKEINPPALIQAIVDVHMGRPVFAGQVATSVLDLVRQQQNQLTGPTGLALLSPQEKRVLAELAAGRSNKEIADLMALSVNTVKNYLVSLYQKLGVNRRAQAVAIYLGTTPSGTANRGQGGLT